MTTETTHDHQLTIRIALPGSASLDDLDKAKNAILKALPKAMIQITFFTGSDPSSRRGLQKLHEGSGESQFTLPERNSLRPGLARGEGLDSVELHSVVDGLKQFADDFADVDPEEFVRDLRAD